MNNLKQILGLIFILLLPSITLGQETTNTKPDKKWEFLIEPYLFFPYMNGTLGLGGVNDVSVDATPKDIFHQLKIGFMLNAEASKGNWHINTDVIYMNLQQDVTPSFFISKGNVTAKQLAWEVAGLYTLNRWLDVGAGVILNSISVKPSLDIYNLDGSTSNFSNNFSQTWLDPMLIARTKNKEGSKVTYMLRTDVGGFGIGAKFAYQIQSYIGYRFSDLFEVSGGYRWIGLDYKKNKTNDNLVDNNRFVYDMSITGPVIRAGFHF